MSFKKLNNNQATKIRNERQLKKFIVSTQIYAQIHQQKVILPSLLTEIIDIMIMTIILLIKNTQIVIKKIVIIWIKITKMISIIEVTEGHIDHDPEIILVEARTI